MSNTGRHEDGDCNPYACRYCEYGAANAREDHERKVCDRYPRCVHCFDAHDCDFAYEPQCRSCNPLYAGKVYA